MDFGVRCRRHGRASCTLRANNYQHNVPFQRKKENARGSSRAMAAQAGALSLMWRSFNRRVRSAVAPIVSASIVFAAQSVEPCEKYMVGSREVDKYLELFQFRLKYTDIRRFGVFLPAPYQTNCQYNMIMNENEQSDRRPLSFFTTRWVSNVRAFLAALRTSLSSWCCARTGQRLSHKTTGRHASLPASLVVGS